MNVSDVNSILDNICDKIGTTAKTLVPEMAGCMIARWSIILVLGVIFLIAALVCVHMIVKMRKENNRVVKLYVNDHGEIKANESWGSNTYKFVYYTLDDYGMWIFGAIMCTLIAATLICLSVSRILGWTLSPNAMTVMWIVNSLGGE